MATLHIKNFPDEESARKQKLHSILELRGLGKELWRSIDPNEHVRAERDSWNTRDNTEESGA